MTNLRTQECNTLWIDSYHATQMWMLYSSAHPTVYHYYRTRWRHGLGLTLCTSMHVVGVYPSQGVRPSPSLDQLPVDQFQTRFSAIFSMTAEQARKMGHGHCKSLVVFFQGLTLVHLHLSPLVLTLVATDPTANIGVLMDSHPFFEEALRPIRAAIEQHDTESTSRIC